MKSQVRGIAADACTGKEGIRRQGGTVFGVALSPRKQRSPWRCDRRARAHCELLTSSVVPAHNRRCLLRTSAVQQAIRRGVEVVVPELRSFVASTLVWSDDGVGVDHDEPPCQIFRVEEISEPALNIGFEGSDWCNSVRKEVSKFERLRLGADDWFIFETFSRFTRLDVNSQFFGTNIATLAKFPPKHRRYPPDLPTLSSR